MKNEEIKNEILRLQFINSPLLYILDSDVISEKTQ